ncbi:hypothetical protein BJV78DRAFT_1213202, partial [Lactifluus subvellereus]
ISQLAYNNDDDDDKVQPQRNKVNLGPSTVHTETPPHVQESVFANVAKARDSIPARREESEQSGNGIGYSILVRMGYKPGHGLGVNLEGQCKAPNIPCGPRCKSPSASSSSHPISPISKHVNKTGSSLPADATTAPRRRSSAHVLNQEPQLDSPAEKSLHSNSVTPPDVGPSSMNGSKSVHNDSILNTNTTKTLPTTRRPDFLQTPSSPQEVAKTRPMASRVPLLPPNAHPPFLPIPSSIPLHLPLPPIDSRANAPVNPLLGSVGVNAFPSNPLPLLPPRPLSGVPYVAKLKGKSVVLGMFPDDKAGGTRGSFPKDLQPPPDLCRSLVMETLPRKFRTDSFVLDWLSQFSFRPSRYELTDGKVFFEFEDLLEANLAWNSPRMGGKEGLQGVRLFWYRKVPPPALQPLVIAEKKDNVTGTIGSPTQPQPHSVSDSPTDLSSDHIESQVAPSRSHDPVYITSSPPLLPPPSTVNKEIELQDPGVVVAPQVEDITPNTLLAALASDSSGDRSAPSPTTTTSSLVPTPSSDHPDQMAANYVLRRKGPPGGALGFSRGSTLSPTLGSAPSPTPASSTSPPLFPTFVPRTLNSWAPPTTSDYQAHPMSQNQGLLQASQSTTQISHPGTNDKQSEFDMVDGARPLTPDLMDTTEDDGALAKEAILRQLVLQSRKRKVASPPASQQPAPGMTSTATSKNTLEELAVNFIVDAIARPPPAKPLAEWGKLLEEHIKMSKLIMSQAEKDKLRALLQEKNRLVDEQKAALFTRSVEDVPVLVSPWPESHPDGGILVLSDIDDDSDDDDDDDDDYIDDTDME